MTSHPPTVVGTERPPWPTDLLAFSPRRRQAQHVLFRQGDVPRDVCSIESGCAKLTRAEGPQKEVIIGRRNPGWVLGAAAATLCVPHPVTATMLGPSAVRQIEAHTFRHILRTNHTTLAWVQQMHASEVRDQALRLAELRQTPRERILGLFQQLLGLQTPVRRGRGYFIQPILTRAEMGQLIGLTREHVSRVIRQLETDGLLLRDGGWIALATGWQCAKTPSFVEDPLRAPKSVTGITLYCDPNHRQAQLSILAYLSPRAFSAVGTRSPYSPPEGLEIST
jgi:CRP-like cAMP-binding protein